MAKIYATLDPQVSDREKRNADRARAIAAQGMVLLENRGVLPLGQGGNIALFGSGARHTVKGGTGSGDVNSRFVVNVEQGLEAAGFTVTSKSWLDRYDQALEDARQSFYDRMRAEGSNVIEKLFNDPFREPPVPAVTQEDIRQARTDTALFVITRNSGEGCDRRPGEGDFELLPEEKEAIRTLAEGFEKFVVVLNVGGVVSTSFLRRCPGIGALLLMSQAGNIGGYALADVLTGKVTPSGHLATTWAENYMDYPSADTFSHMNGDLNDEYYREGIYVGYRYFDTFGVKPAYPFGYGLSYTDFSLETLEAKAQGESLELAVQVTNTGKTYSGRAVVQIYYSAPEGSLEKPYQELAAYGKTGLLAPGQSQVLNLSYPLASMASYDEAAQAYVLEPGTYYVRVGEHSRSTHIAAALCLPERKVTQQLKNLFPLDCRMELLSPRGAVPYTYEGEQKEKEQAPRLTISPEQMPSYRPEYSVCGQEKEIPAPEEPGVITAGDVREGRASLDDLVGQLTIEEMADLCIGVARGDWIGESVIGVASSLCPGAAGDTSARLQSQRDIRSMVLADGPAGLRLCRRFVTDRDGRHIRGLDDIPFSDADIFQPQREKPQMPEGAKTYYQYCTAIPIATLLAQTWDLEAVREAGDIVGGEMKELGVTLWLAPGMNIHRNPLCGRNFEYYSEDPLVAGLCAAADTQGVQKYSGIGTTIKHFAFNNQEDNRMHTSAHIPERAIREIYLKGFEIAVRLSQPRSIMTSYNLIDGLHTANSYALVTNVARDEWGFKGIFMTDWATTRHDPNPALKYGCSSAAGCIAAGNDLTMPGSQEDLDEILRSVNAAPGQVPYPLTRAQLQACTKRILNSVLTSSAYED